MRDHRDIRLSRVASRQKGVVALGDVRAVSMDKHAVARRVEVGRLHPLFPGTWAVGHCGLTREAWHLAGVLSAGKGALLTGVSACQLYGVFGRKVGEVHVVRAGKAAQHGRLRIHHAKNMPPRRKRKGIPVVPIEEALIGLAADPDVTDQEVRRAIRQAYVDKHTTHAKLTRAVERAKGRPGIRRLKLFLNDNRDRSKSELEDAAIDLLRRYDMQAIQNVEIAGEEADLLIDGVVVELDSETFHDNPISAADDARRQELWEGAGLTVLRWTWDDVHATPVRTLRRLRAAVASPA
jgi:very-short-patch-repair endonuclease